MGLHSLINAASISCRSTRAEFGIVMVQPKVNGLSAEQKTEKDVAQPYLHTY